MYSFATTSPEGFPTLEWYLEDGTLAATSVRPPTDPDTEIWDHFAEDGQTVGRSLKVGTGYGHYSPAGELIEETTLLSGFWELCDLKRMPAARPVTGPDARPAAIQAGARAASSQTARQPRHEETRPAPRTWTPVMVGVVLLAVLGSAGGFVILALPQKTIVQWAGVRPGMAPPGVPWDPSVAHPVPANPAPPSSQPSRRPRPDPVPEGVESLAQSDGPPAPMVAPVTPSSPGPAPSAHGPHDDRTAILVCLRSKNSGSGGDDLRVQHLEISGAWACAVTYWVDASGRTFTEPLSDLLGKDEQGVWKVVSYIEDWQPPRDSDAEVNDAMDFARADTQQGILRQYPDFPASIFPRPMGPVVTTEEVIRTMAREMMELEQARNLPAFMSFFAQEVSSQNLANVPRETLRQQKLRAFQLWPLAQYEVVGEIEVTAVEPGVWQATLVSTFQLENNTGERNAGRRRIERTFTLLHDRYQVTAERWEVLPAMDEKEMVRQFVVRNRLLENRQALDELMPSYAEEVDYFDKGTLTRDEIRRDKERYFERWPVAVQTIISPVVVEALGVARYRVTYDTQFHVRHPVEGRAREGKCQCELVIAALPGGSHIVFERAAVIFTQSVPVQPLGGSIKSGGNPPPRQRTSEGGPPRKESFEEMTRRLNKL